MTDVVSPEDNTETVVTIEPHTEQPFFSQSFHMTNVDSAPSMPMSPFSPSDSVFSPNGDVVPLAHSYSFHLNPDANQSFFSSRDAVVYLDIDIDGEYDGRVYIKLSQDPALFNVVENFRALCTGEKGISQKTGKKLWYRRTKIHRVIRNKFIHAGDLIYGNGYGSDCIYDQGTTFSDPERPFPLKLTKGAVAMASNGPNTLGSQFFICLDDFSSKEALNQKYVVFGEVVENPEYADRQGFAVLKNIESVALVNGSLNYPVVISYSGQVGRDDPPPDRHLEREKATEEKNNKGCVIS